MRNVILSQMVSLDGYFAGPDDDISWHVVGEEFNDYASDLLDNAGALLFGRVTYELMASYWPTAAALANDPVIATKMNSLPKVVFSRTLFGADWRHARVARGEMVDEIATLKQQPGKDLVILGSGSLVPALTRHGLIDEYRIIVNPVVLGGGKPLFQDIHDHLRLTLLSARPLGTGLVILTYRPA